MDYSIGGMIYLDEFDNMLMLTNPGFFIPKSVQEVLKADYCTPYYRNPLLMEAMAGFNMIENSHMGVRQIFMILRERYFPMPDYELGISQKVTVSLYGKVLDINFTHLLFDNPTMDPIDILLLDRAVEKSSACQGRDRAFTLFRPH
jgi:ATP-dependent DNA helicase RecG